MTRHGGALEACGRAQAMSQSGDARAFQSCWSNPFHVMAELGPAIPVLLLERKSWMAGTRPAMTWKDWRKQSGTHSNKLELVPIISAHSRVSGNPGPRGRSLPL